VLNVKSLIVKNNSDQMKVITVEKSTPGPITGHDIHTGGEVQVINKDTVLATLTTDTPFMMEMVVQNGRGYVPVLGIEERSRARNRNHSAGRCLQPSHSSSLCC
jgi:DNA-directed RNA polymerase alpha subunit